jgi:Kinesin motor domain
MQYCVQLLHETVHCTAGATGQRLVESGSINKSLLTLGNVINALADSSNSGNSAAHIPYRNSTLTWLLRQSLGGNARTIMIATVSPSCRQRDETLSTLRYAERAKRIQTHAVVNEDPNVTIIRQLRQEIEQLRAALQSTQAGLNSSINSSAGLSGVMNFSNLKMNDSLMSEMTSVSNGDVQELDDDVEVDETDDTDVQQVEEDNNDSYSDNNDDDDVYSTEALPPPPVAVAAAITDVDSGSTTNGSKSSTSSRPTRSLSPLTLARIALTTKAIAAGDREFSASKSNLYDTVNAITADTKISAMYDNDSNDDTTALPSPATAADTRSTSTKAGVRSSATAATAVTTTAMSLYKQHEQLVLQTRAIVASIQRDECDAVELFDDYCESTEIHDYLKNDVLTLLPQIVTANTLLQSTNLSSSSSGGHNSSSALHDIHMYMPTLLCVCDSTGGTQQLHQQQLHQQQQLQQQQLSVATAVRQSLPAKSVTSPSALHMRLRSADGFVSPRAAARTFGNAASPTNNGAQQSSRFFPAATQTRPGIGNRQFSHVRKISGNNNNTATTGDMSDGIVQHSEVSLLSSALSPLHTVSQMRYAVGVKGVNSQGITVRTWSVTEFNSYLQQLQAVKRAKVTATKQTAAAAVPPLSLPLYEAVNEIRIGVAAIPLTTLLHHFQMRACVAVIGCASSNSSQMIGEVDVYMTVNHDHDRSESSSSSSSELTITLEIERVRIQTATNKLQQGTMCLRYAVFDESHGLVQEQQQEDDDGYNASNTGSATTALSEVTFSTLSSDTFYTDYDDDDIDITSSETATRTSINTNSIAAVELGHTQCYTFSRASFELLVQLQTGGLRFEMYRILDTATATTDNAHVDSNTSTASAVEDESSETFMLQGIPVLPRHIAAHLCCNDGNSMNSRYISGIMAVHAPLTTVTSSPTSATVTTTVPVSGTANVGGRGQRKIRKTSVLTPSDTNMDSCDGTAVTDDSCTIFTTVDVLEARTTAVSSQAQPLSDYTPADYKPEQSAVASAVAAASDSSDINSGSVAMTPITSPRSSTSSLMLSPRDSSVAMSSSVWPISSNACGAFYIEEAANSTVSDRAVVINLMQIIQQQQLQQQQQHGTTTDDNDIDALQQQMSIESVAACGVGSAKLSAKTDALTAGSPKALPTVNNRNVTAVSTLKPLQLLSVVRNSAYKTLTVTAKLPSLQLLTTPCAKGGRVVVPLVLFVYVTGVLQPLQISIDVKFKVVPRADATIMTSMKVLTGRSVR